MRSNFLLGTGRATHHCRLSRLSALAAALVLAGYVPHAYATQFDWGNDVTGSFDTTITYGALWRTQSPSPSLIPIAEGGTGRDPNISNGDLNYVQGEMVNSIVRIGEELNVKYKNYTLFARGDYAYDFQAANHRDNFGPEGRDLLISRARMLDAFISADYNIGGHRVNIRLGRQVLNWGESTFIQNGLNAINSIDVSTLRQPGSKLKNALLPNPAISFSVGLTNKLSLSGFILTSFNHVLLDPDGAFFSQTDALSPDGDRVYLSFGRVPGGGVHDATPSDNFITRAPDNEPSGWHQYGLSLHYVVPALNYTDFGLYYEHLDSHIPFLSAIAQQNRAVPGSGVVAGVVGFPIPGHDGTAHYFADYPSGINVYGLSFSTSLPFGIALQGEYTYRPNDPVQLAPTAVILSSLGLPSEIAPKFGAFPGGSVIRGYRRVKAQQFQFTVTKLFGHPGLGASQLVVLSEFGANYLDLPSDLKFGGPGTTLPILAPFYGPGGPLAAETAKGSLQTGNFTTRFSWGYRAIAQLQYLNLFHNVTVTPNLAWSQDVTGNGPNFNHGNKALTLGVDFEYLNHWHASVAYTNFFGGHALNSGVDPIPTAGQPSSYYTSSYGMKDRDFISATISYSF